VTFQGGSIVPNTHDSPFSVSGASTRLGARAQAIVL